MTRIDINCDLGEGEPLAKTRPLMRLVTSVNIACGGHAGDARSMERCLLLAKRYGVRAGAHPGWRDRQSFGRGSVKLSADELQLLLLHQIGALHSMARNLSVPLTHVKLHGALYHLTDTDPALRQTYLNAVRRFWPDLVIYARAGGPTHRAALRAGLRVWPELFLDRAYEEDGRLRSRDEVGSLLTDPKELKERLLLIREGEGIRAVTGKLLPLKGRTLCIHSDSPGALRMARLAAAVLRSRFLVVDKERKGRKVGPSE